MDRQAKLFISALLTALAGTSGLTAAKAATVLERGARAVSSDTGFSVEVVAEILKYLGWTYFPPRPKSRQAAWDNYAHQTTWWNSYWYNFRTHRVSYRQPSALNSYLGDNLFRRPSKDRWRAGGPPALCHITPIQRLCMYDETQGELYSE